ncbi:MAG TPA: DUF202 domain-containing protein [Asanoa sp.]
MTDPAADPSAAAERTRLSWRRTVLSGAAVALLAARFCVELLDRDAAVVGGLLAGIALLGWVVFAAVAGRRMRALAGGRATVDPALTGGGATSDPVALVACAAGAVGAALFGAGLVLAAVA